MTVATAGYADDHYFICSPRLDPDQVNNPGSYTSATEFVIQSTPAMNAALINRATIAQTDMGRFVVVIEHCPPFFVTGFNAIIDIESASRSDILKYVGNVLNSN